MKKNFILLFIIHISLVINVPYAAADEFDAINFIAGVNVQYDNNLFRLPSGADVTSLVGKSNRSDTITSAYAGIKFDKTYSLQRFKFDVTETKYRYNTYDFLNFSATDYKGAWLWALTPYLTGNFSISRAEALNDFKDYNNYKVLNIRETEIQRFDADWAPYGNWHLLTGINRINQTNSETFNAESGYSQIGYDLGVKYVFPTNNSISFLSHARQGKYDGRLLNALALLDTGFDEKEFEGRLDWLVSPYSRINAKLAHVDREHDNFSQRDYSQAFGNVAYTWMPSSKLQFQLTAARDVASYQLITSSYTNYDSLDLTSSWLISNKLTLKAKANIAKRRFNGTVAVVPVKRVDSSQLESLEFIWKPYTAVSVGTSVQHSTRDSTLPGLEYSDTTASIYTQFLF